MTNFPQVLDSAIAEFEEYKKEEKNLEKKILLSAIVSRLWNLIGYYCGSAGHVSQDAVKRYILEQQGKPVFDYSIFGDSTGQRKIGDFTGQTKLAGWS